MNLMLAFPFRRLLVANIVCVPDSRRVAWFWFVYSITWLRCRHFGTHICMGSEDWRFKPRVAV